MKNLFEVKKIRLHTGIDGFNSPNAYGIYKSSGGEALGVLGNVFTPTQPKDLYDFFSKGISAAGFKVDDIQYRELKGGKKIMFLLPCVKEFSFKSKVDDVMQVGVAVQTGYDGHTPTAAFIRTNRLVCSNGMRVSKTEWAFKVRNTLGNFGKIGAIAKYVTDAVKYSETLQGTFKRLSSKKVTEAQRNEFVRKVTGLDMNNYADLKKRQQARLDEIFEAIAIEEKDAGFNAWALLNGITRYTNHNVENSDDYVYAGSGLVMNNKAQKEAVALLN